MGRGGLEQAVEKAYVMDTNVALLNPFCPFILTGNDIPEELLREPMSRAYGRLARESQKSKEPNALFIPANVLWEMNDLKDRYRAPEELKYAARMALQVLYHIRDRFGSTGRLLLELDADGKDDDAVSPIRLPNRAPIFTYPFNEKAFQRHQVGAGHQPTVDDRIIYEILQLKETAPWKDMSVVFITEDVACRGLAMDHGIDVEPFLHERVADGKNSYTGNVEVSLPVRQLETIAQKEKISKTQVSRLLTSQTAKNLHPNQFVVFPDGSPTPTILVARKKEHTAEPPSLHSLAYYKRFLNYLDQQPDLLEYANYNPGNQPPGQLFTKEGIISIIKNHWGKRTKPSKQYISQIRAFPDINAPEAQQAVAAILRETGKPGLMERYYAFTHNKGIMLPFDKELRPRELQRAQVELLMDPTIGLVTVEGGPGAGKTLMSVYAAMVQVQMGVYNHVLYLRPPAPLQHDMGALPGSLEQKEAPWVRPLWENLTTIFGGYRSDRPLNYEKRVSDQIQALRQQNIISAGTPTMLGGRDLKNTFIILDEAQFLNRASMYILTTRPGLGSKIAVIGDRGQAGATTREFGLNPHNSGFAHLIKDCPGHAIYGHIHLGTGYSERGQVPELISGLWGG